jgi:cell wall-associated NlpC family hydrolase
VTHRFGKILAVSSVLALGGVLVIPAAESRAASNESVLSKVKHFFTGTPTPMPSPKKKKTPAKKTPPATPRGSAPRHPKASQTPPPTSTPSRTPSPTPAATTTPETSPLPPEGEQERSPAGTYPPMHQRSTAMEPSETPASTAQQASPRSPPQPSRPAAAPGGIAPATVAGSEIIAYDRNPPAIRKILDLALDLTTKNLTYKYGSADPGQGGMDCSGFIFYVLNQAGMKNVPRDAREQYIWVRKAGRFQAVLGRSPDTFELDALKPGDLLFWAGTYNVDRDPAITHTMIYLGRDKASNQRLMVGASDGRTYKGQPKYGVSVFDFKMAGRRASTTGEPGPVFVGYASIPDLPQE